MNKDFQELHTAVLGMLPCPVSKNKIKISPLREGGNNRLYRVETPDGNYVLKSYFRHPGDIRNRLDVEFTFASFAWRHGIHCIPEPLCRNDSIFCALFGLVEGRPLSSGEVGMEEISQALNFFLDLNALRTHSEALTLANASESCFTLHEHIQRIDERFDRFRAITTSDELDRQCLEFVKSPLTAVWMQIRRRIENSADYSTDVPLEPTDRVISPSDFGFHNAINTESGLIFLDFEYAGWDDPAKVAGDFFSQVAVPVSTEFFAWVADAISEATSEPEKMLQRIRLLLPLYRIKWCCILLNDFLPIDGARREFAQGRASERKKEQLEKAKNLLVFLEQLMIATSRN
ncbi:MAG: phosphotransferase [Syntrophales bacterium]|jgi:hypothetical protein